MIKEDVEKVIRFFKLFSYNGEAIWKNKKTKETKKMFIHVMERQPQNNELQSFQCEANKKILETQLRITSLKILFCLFLLVTNAETVSRNWSRKRGEVK